jgi:haloacetate dehalogenase
MPQNVSLSDGFFPGFRALDVDAGNGITIRARTGGKGPALLLLHGYPQTHVMWHLVAPKLADDFTIVVADLRGYGDSSKPPSDAQHLTYSKRAMAADMVAVMDALGHRRFLLAGHDRGGRVAHRLAIDHPERVEKLAVLDIAPTREMYRNTTEAFARAYWHWFFLIQPNDFPERMILADTDAYWLRKSTTGSKTTEVFAPEALAEYLRCFRDPACVHASCEDYRAGASIDIVHDDEDGDKKLPMPLHVLWGKKGAIEKCFDALALWRQRAEHVTGSALPGAHYLAEELPEETARELREFFESKRV